MVKTAKLLHVWGPGQKGKHVVRLPRELVCLGAMKRQSIIGLLIIGSLLRHLEHLGGVGAPVT